MNTSTVKKFLKRRHLLDAPDGAAFIKLQKHWRNIVWITLILVICFIASAVMTRWDWWGWVILAVYGVAAVHEIYMTWHIKRLFQKRGAQRSDEYFVRAAQSGKRE